MTPQEEIDYLTQLLTRMARQPGGSNITELGLRPIHRNDYLRLSKRLQAERLAEQTDPDYAYHLTLTHQGMQAAALPGGYAAYLAQGVAETQQVLKKDEEARRQTRLATNAAIVSAVAAVVTIAVSVWLSYQPNPQVEALTKRVEMLEAQARSTTSTTSASRPIKNPAKVPAIQPAK